MRPVLHKAVMFLLYVIVWMGTKGQTNITYDLKKPKGYENRKLASELTPDKKINPVKRLKQDIVTHYNFQFNANQKLKKVVENARKSHKDTFTSMLSFDDFSLDNTALEAQELDSVVLKANNGVLLHDLRNDWVDDLFLLMGQSYFYQKKFDSAYDVFQYINYNYQPKEKNDLSLERPIGSAINNGSTHSVSSPEARITLHRPARNQALLWIVRIFLQQELRDEAKGLIEMLNRDPKFPARLRPQLDEMQARWFYNQKSYDSSAHYLKKTVDAGQQGSDKARTYFLLAQMYAASGNKQMANDAYEKVVNITTDPVMEAYARINQIALAAEEKDLDLRITNNIRALLQMASKEKYASYKGIIFNAASTLEKGRGNYIAALELMIEGNKSELNPDLKNEGRIQIADLAFDLKKYELSKKYFDSTNISGPNEALLNLKKSTVTTLAKALETVRREDSLQRIAQLPEKERNAAINAVLKKLEKEKGMADLKAMMKGDLGPKNNLNDENSGSLFSQEPSRGEWYFNNPGLKSQGSQAFKNKWGTRENTDNWRRSASQTGAAIPKNNDDNPTPDDEESPTDESLTEESLLSNLPLSKDAFDASNAKKALACRQLAITYKDKLGNCAESVKWNEMTLLLTKDSSVMEPALFDLAYCYKKMGMSEKAKEKENQLASTFPNGKLTGLLLNPKSKNTTVSQADLAATREYQRIYDLFLAGRFDEALKAKQNADAIHPNSQWTPQLLYIESVYYIKTRKDSLALSTLNKIPALFPGSPLAEKAGIMADVVFRRSEIEHELEQMQVVRQKEDSITWIDDRPAAKPREERVVRASTNERPKSQQVAAPAIKDSIIFKPNVPVDTVARQKEIFTFIPNEPHLALMMMQNIDVVYVNEAKRALDRYHAINYGGTGLTMSIETLGKQQAILISGFPSAAETLAYVEKTAPIATKEIFPWLTADKYRFWMIGQSNFDKLKTLGNTDTYLEFMRKQFPGKF